MAKETRDVPYYAKLMCSECEDSDFLPVPKKWNILELVTVCGPCRNKIKRDAEKRKQEAKRALPDNIVQTFRAPAEVE